MCLAGTRPPWSAPAASRETIMDDIAVVEMANLDVVAVRSNLIAVSTLLGSPSSNAAEMEGNIRAARRTLARACADLADVSDALTSILPDGA